jgi:hypothetical protein
MSIGDVLSDTFELYKRHFTHFVPIAAVYFLVLSLLTLVLTLLLSWLGAIISAFVSIVGIFWLQGALVEAIADVRDGRADLTIGETFKRAQPYILRLLGAGFLAGIGIFIGFLLLIVPGFILLTWWSLIVPVIVLEGVAVMDSFGRSRELVRGNGWNVFGVIIITAILIAVVGSIIRAIFLWLPDEVGYYISNVISNSLLVPVAAIAWTLMYYRLARQEVGVEPAPVEPGPTAA